MPCKQIDQYQIPAEKNIGKDKRCIFEWFIMTDETKKTDASFDWKTTSECFILRICPSVRISRFADSVTALPFLYQAMTGGGTALDSHSKVTDLPTSTFISTGESRLLPRILGGTARLRRKKNITKPNKTPNSKYY